MDRRSFLHRGALGASGVAAVGQPALVAAAQRGGSPLYSMDDYLARMDEGLARVQEWSILHAAPDFSGDVSAVDDLGRKAFSSLYMTAMFSDLPIEEQVRPEVQDRMWAVQQTMDEAMDDMSAFLKGQTPEALEDVQKRLQADPDAIARVAEILDVEAARTGLSDRRRRQTRTMIEQLGWRLANQPPALLVNEYAAKVDKIDASDIEEEARQRWLASKVGEEVFWTVAQEERSLRERRISRGQRNMGIGAVIFLGSALLVAVGAAVDGEGGDGLVAIAALGLLGGTVGAIWLLVGFIQLLIGVGTSPSA